MINQIRASVEAEFAQVNALIIEQLHSDVDMVENVGQYIVDAGGKRLRPLLALLAAASMGDVTEKHIKFAAVIEFIHTATLLHDDVVESLRSDAAAPQLIVSLVMRRASWSEISSTRAPSS